jgi:plasmid stabilization system protein ParE
MALKIVWSKRATLKFDQIVSYLVKEWGENSAKEFIGKVFDFLEKKEKTITMPAIIGR